MPQIGTSLKIRDDYEIGELDPAWNHLVGLLPSNENANIAHYTLGGGDAAPGAHGAGAVGRVAHGPGQGLGLLRSADVGEDEAPGPGVQEFVLRGVDG